MRLRWRIGVATAATIAASIWSAYAAQRSGAIRSSLQAVELRPELNLWQREFERDTRSIAVARRRAEQRIAELRSEMSVMQGRILRLDSLARSLAEQAGLDEEEFDFGSAPGLGGPETSFGDDAVWEPDPSPDLVDVTVAVSALGKQVENRREQLDVLDDLLRWRELSDAVRPEGRPVASAYVSSPFGARIDPFTGRPAAHKGIDFAGRAGTEIVAVAAGIVTWSGPRSGYGRMVEIDHGNQHVTRYAHNAENLVAVGDVVTRGQPIARLGSTGRATGPNLHFEVLQAGRAVNPVPYIE